MAEEQKLQKKIIDWLNAKGFYVVKTISCSKAGVPDILCAAHGRFLGIEVKSEKGIVSKLQTHNLMQIMKCGGIAIVARSLDDVKDGIKSLDNIPEGT